MDITTLADNCIYKAVTLIRQQGKLCFVHFDHWPTGVRVEPQMALTLVEQADADGKLLSKARKRAWKGGPWQYVYQIAGNDYGKFFPREAGQLDVKPLQVRPYIEQKVRNKRHGGLRWEVVS